MKRRGNPSAINYLIPKKGSGQEQGWILLFFRPLTFMVTVKKTEKTQFYANYGFYGFLHKSFS